MNGYGTTQAPDGSTYTGYKFNGMANGQGTLTGAKGTKYVGGFQGGKPHGQGVFSFPNGMTVEGEFRNGAANGQATMTMLDGTYVGEFRDGKPNGQGTATSLGGMKYVGEFKDGIFNGHGTATALDGRKYVGQWRDGKRNGQGTTTYADGRILSGIWADTKNTREISPEEFASILPVGAVQVQVGKSGNLAAERKRIELEKQRLELEKQELAAETVERQRLDAEHQRLETEKQRIKAQKAQLAERPKPSNIDGPRERRVALVIGNGAYKVAPLKNPTNDAQDMADALREMGFDVSLKVNASHKEMEQAVREFGAKLKQGGLGLFYYAGHGVQVAGENYLIPVDTKIDAEADVKFGALNAGMALARMEDAGNDLNIVILDACRTNPFARSFRTAEQGLARMDAPKGSLIAYATAPGRVAADSGGTGRNGVYTSFLLRHMRTPGLKVEEALKRVRSDVVRATKDKQVPWESSSLMGDFYFVSGGQQVSSLGQSVPATMPMDLAAEKKRVAEDAERLISEQQELVKLQTEKQRIEAERQKMALEKQQLILPPLPKQQPPLTTLTAPVGNQKKAWKPWGEITSPTAPTHSSSMKEETQKQADTYSPGMVSLREHAEKGKASAQEELCYKYSNGHGVLRDYNEAERWCRKAADQGNVYAQSKLGQLYIDGNGVNSDYNEAVRWFRKAAENGNAFSQFRLAGIYHGGHGVTVNYTEAIFWARKAADQGYAAGQALLASMYALGDGVNQSYEQAFKWTKKASDQGYVLSQAMLGKMYDNGQGVPQNYVEAAKWYRKAANSGDNIAQTSLGAMYIKGEGVPKSLVQAHMWFSIAATSGDAKVLEARDVIASKMTPAQIAEAQRLASQWRPKTPEELGYKSTAVAGAGEEPTARGSRKVVAARKNNKAQK